jgi:hypothetical protein
MKPPDKISATAQMRRPEALRGKFAVVVKEFGDDFVLNFRRRGGFAFGNKAHHFGVAIQFEEQRRVGIRELAEMHPLRFRKNI